MARRSSSVTTNPPPRVTDCWHHATFERKRSYGSIYNVRNSIPSSLEPSFNKNSKPYFDYALFAPKTLLYNFPGMSLLTTIPKTLNCNAPGKSICNPYRGITTEGATTNNHEQKNNSGILQNQSLPCPPLRLPFIMRQHAGTNTGTNRHGTNREQ